MNQSIKLGLALVAATMIAALVALYAYNWHVAQAQWGVVFGTLFAGLDIGLSRSVRRLGLVPVVALMQMACWAMFWGLMHSLTSMLVLGVGLACLGVSHLLARATRRWVIVPKESARVPIKWRRPTLGETLLLGTMALAGCAPAFGASLHLPLSVFGIALGSYFTLSVIQGARRLHRPVLLPFVALALMVASSIFLSPGLFSLMWLVYLVPYALSLWALLIVLYLFVVGSDEDLS